MANIIKQLKDTNGNNIYPIAYAQGGMKMDLLWTNPSPSASFSAQTVSLDLSDYELLLIETIYDTTDAPNTRTINTIKADTEGYNNSLFSCVNGYFQSRDCSVSSTGINFLEGKNASHNTRNQAVVPNKIYGIKMSYVVPTSVHGLQYVEV